MDDSLVQSYAPLGKAVAPRASMTQVVWYVFWFLAFIVLMLLERPLFAVPTLLLIMAGFVVTDERPLFLAIPYKLYFLWRYFRNGVAVKRQFSSRDVSYRKGISPLKGLFEISATNVSVQLSNGAVTSVPVFQSAGRHSIIVIGRNSGDTETATPRERDSIDAQRAAMMGRATKTLGVGNTIASWSITRPLNPHPGDQYLALRADKEVMDSTDPLHQNNVSRAYESKAVVDERSWTRQSGITLNATDPRSWKPRRLHRMKPEQVRESLALKAALEIEASAKRAKIDKAHIARPLEFAGLSREVWSLGPELNDVRRHELFDKTLAKQVKPGEAQPDLWLEGLEPMPQMQRELGIDYMILDGTYHRIMWVVDSSLRRVQAGYYDQLHQMDCPNIVSLSTFTVSRKDDEKRRNVRTDARDLLTRSRRYQQLDDDEATRSEEEGKVEVFQSEGLAIYGRLVLIASGRSFEEMEWSESIIRDTASGLNLELRTIVGADQVVWFWAAIGVITK